MLLVELVGTLDPTHLQCCDCRLISTTPYDGLKHLLQSPPNDEVRLVICHDSMDSVRKNCLETLCHRSAASLLLVSSGAATLEFAKELAMLHNSPDRIFGAASKGSAQEFVRGWQHLIQFFDCGQSTPWVETFLGLGHAPRAFAVQLAMEIAQAELKRQQPAETRALPPDIVYFLDNAMLLACSDPVLWKAVQNAQAINEDTSLEEALAAIGRALTRLHSL
jgi:hypothetical protein